MKKRIFIILIFLTTTLSAKLHAQTVEQYKMSSVEIVAGGFITGIEFHPKVKGVAYVRTDIGGAYRLDTTLERWIPLTDYFGPNDWNYLGIDAIGLDPNDANRLYLGAGTYTNGWAGNGAILRSTNRGDSFETVDLPFMLGGNEDGRSTGEKLVIDPHSGNILYLGTRRNGLWKSADYGVTWTQISTFPIGASTTNNIGITFILFNDKSGMNGTATPEIYVGTADKDSNLYVSSNAGETWSKVPNQPTGVLPHHAKLNDKNEMFLSYSDAPGPNGITTGAIWKLNISDNTWIKLLEPDGQGGFGGLTMDAQNNDIIMVGTLDRWWPGDEVYRTNDGGNNWKPITPTDIRDVSASPYVAWHKKVSTLGTGNWIGDIEIDPFNQNNVYYGTGATIWGCQNITELDADKPTNWKIFAAGIEETSVLQIASPPFGPILYSAMADISGFSHNDVSKSPPNGFFSIDGYTNTGIDFAYLNPNFVVRVGYNDAPIAWSSDFGETWNEFENLPDTDAKAGKVSVAADGLSIVWKPEGMSPYVTSDNGVTWALCEELGNDAKIIADKVNAQIFYAVNGSSFFKSTDAGLTFSKTSTVSLNAKISSVPLQEGKVWLAASNGLFKSEDGGLNFVKITGAINVESVGIGKGIADIVDYSVFIIGRINNIYGVFRSDDYGATWLRVNDDKHQYGAIHDIIGDPKTFGRYYFCTNGRGIIYGDPVFDCNKDSLGTAFFDVCGTCVGGNTEVIACSVVDCNGVTNGSAFVDQCGECVGGNTGLSACSIYYDCNGDLNGLAYADDCDNCVGGNTSLEPCVTKINEIKSDLYRIYPNPSNGGFNLKANKAINYLLSDASGKACESGVCSDYVQFGNGLEAGVYILTIYNLNAYENIKLIKQ